MRIIRSRAGRRSRPVGWDTTPQHRPFGDEIASAAIQGSAAVASALGFGYLATDAGAVRGSREFLAATIYCTSMFVAFVVSAVYHGLPYGRAKAVLQRVDHCMIFLFIAGTYTPVALLPLRDHGGEVLLGVIWILAMAGILLRLTNEFQFRRVAVPLYLVMGWLCSGWSVPLYRNVETLPMVLMIAGGLSYTGGLLFFRWHRVPHSNPLWHLCVVAGSLSFFVAIAHLLAA